MTIAIIAGGRDFSLTTVHHEYLDQLHTKLRVSEVLCGCAPGADAGGELWATKNQIKVTRFPADWKAHGRAAGPKRNRQMAIHAEPRGVCILFPGGKGTRSMRELALNHGLRVFEFPHLSSV